MSRIPPVSLLCFLGLAPISALAQPDAALVAAWNERAYDVAYAEDQFFTFKGHRAFAMMHLAMHDALNTIEPRYTRYVCDAAPTDADPTAAAAQAAYEVLATQYPDQRPAFAAELQRWLGGVPAGVQQARGVALGRACASAVLALRAGDGWDMPGEYAFRAEPGQYQTTGTWEDFMLQPGFRYARPFALTAPDQFRPPPLPGLASVAYAEAFAEVRDQGHVASTTRTDDQTGYAVWWMEFAEGSVNRIARELVAQQDTDLWEAARLFSLLNVALYDGYVAVWDSKYEYNHWRPETAIHAAADDGNPDTGPVDDWRPLRPTPPFQDYASAHATACAASFGALAHVFGDATPFTMRPTTAPDEMPTRSFTRFSAAAAECADSRIQLGWHFRYAADEGLVLGRRVLDYLTTHYFLPE